MDEAAKHADQALIVRSGDTLILRVARRLSGQEHDWIQQKLRPGVPESVSIVILSGIDQMAVVKP